MSTTTTTRKALLYITIAKVTFILFAFAQSILLPNIHFLGNTSGQADAGSWGVWTNTLAWISAFNNVIVIATIQVVSHFSQRYPIESVKRTALTMQMFFGGAITLFILIAASFIGRFEHDPFYPTYIRIGALVTLCYSIYCVFVGAANGTQQFKKQAALDMLFSVLRLTLIAGMAYLTHKVIGAWLGFVAAAVIITLFSILLVGWPKPKPDDEKVPMKPMFIFIGWLVFYLFFANLLMFADGFWLKRIATEQVSAWNNLAFSSDSLHQIVDNYLMSTYGAAQQLARLPYQLIIAAAFVIFPLLSQAAAKGHEEQARQYMQTSLRYSLIAIIGIALALGIRAQGLFLLIWGKFADADHSLQFLLVAYVAFSLSSIIATMLNSLGKIRLMVLSSFASLVISCVSIYLCLKNASSPEHLLVNAAKGMLIGQLVSLALNLAILWKEFKVTFLPTSLVRISLAILPCIVMGWLWPSPTQTGLLAGKIGTLACCSITIIVYFLILFITKELSLKEIFSSRKERPLEQVPTPNEPSSTDTISSTEEVAVTAL